jgi:hypothetical protein
MTLGIMQPYLFPYIGYFQLVKHVDKFVFYDDVNFIKQGWINRNRILLNRQPSFFTIPVKNISSFEKICNTEIDLRSFQHWRTKFFKTLQDNYRSAPYYDDVLKIVRQVLFMDTSSIGEMAKQSVLLMASYIGVETLFVSTSSIYRNDGLRAQSRVLDICLSEKANRYINVSGGVELYNENDFRNSGVDLFFIKSNDIEYKQGNHQFHPWLSIIDVAMFCSIDLIRIMLNDCKIFKA